MGATAVEEKNLESKADGTSWAAKVAEDPILRYFTYEHIPSEKLREASKPFCELALHIVATVPRNPERTVALRKLLEAKDCAVRASLP